MHFKQKAFDLVKILICCFGLISTFYMVVEFTYFLSIPNKITPGNVSQDPWLTSSWALLVDMSLLSMFILQHSVLVASPVKEAFDRYGLHVIFRSLYVISTSGILLVLTRYWKTTDLVLWEFNLKYKPILWLYFGVQTIAWLTIYVGNICTDVTELLGIKQVYYSIVNLTDPNLRKSAQLQRFNAHLRHPSFLAFVLIFWLYPIMSLDRILLALVLTSYMYIAWNPDERDYYYHKYQYERKYHELDRLQKNSY